MIKDFKIVDGHVHTFPSDQISEKIINSFNKIYNIEFDNFGTGTIEDVLSNMSDIGIDYTIMANFAPAKILHSHNLWGISIHQKHKNLIPLVSFHPDMEGNLGMILEDYISRGAKGIKIHPMSQGFIPSHDSLNDVYNYCNQISLPVVFHCGRVSNARLNEYADLEMIMPVIEKYPDIPIILTHMVDGNIEDVIRLSENYKNVYFDSSIVITGHPLLLEVNEPSWVDDSTVIDVINAIGSERLLFGSDFPWGSPKHDVDRFIKMDLSDEQKSRILGENSIRVFNLE